MKTFVDTGVSPARLSQIIRSARNLMNNNGRHWVKGTEKIPLDAVDPQTHTYENVGPINYFLALNDPKQEYAFCSIGAVKEVTANHNEYKAALFELAMTIDPGSVEEIYLQNASFHGFSSEDFSKQNLFDSIDDGALGDIIAEFNDNHLTKWEDVKGWFTKSAARVSKRKG